jgi:probable F420-dependent oxidoreductase
MRIGAKVPNSGPLPTERGIAAMAAELESAGFESLWVSDHIVMPSHIESRYPFAADGRPTWPSGTAYFDAMIALAVIATATQRAAIGTAVLVLPLRQPVVLAKQAASIDVLSGGRLVLGVGAGWLAEEFEALDVPFGSRGRRFTEWLQILRACWTGEPRAFDGEHYRLPEGVLALPAPGHDIPVLVGGDSATALSRAATTGDGWLAHQSAEALDFEALRMGVEKLREDAKRSGRAPGELWTTVRIIDSSRRPQAVADALPRLREIGVDEVVVDTDWNVDGSAAEAYGILRDGASR